MINCGWTPWHTDQLQVNIWFQCKSDGCSPQLMQYKIGTPLICCKQLCSYTLVTYLIKVCLLVFGAVRWVWERFFASWVLAKVWFLSRMCSEVNLEIFQPRKGLGTTRILHWKRKLHLRICTFSWVNNLWLFMCGAVAYMFVFGPLWRMVHWFKSGYWCM